MRWMLRLGVMVAVCIVGRELHLRQTEITAVASEVDQQRVAIAETEARIDALEREIDEKAARLTTLDAEIDRKERRHPRGIPRSEYPAYAALVEERNSVAGRRNVLIAHHREMASGYTHTVDAHNAGVDEIHALARRAAPTAAVKDLWRSLVDSVTGDE
jgi:chromosome segregation ATPase